MKIFEDKNLCEKLNKIKKQISYREELDKIKEREKKYLDRRNKNEEQSTKTDKNPESLG